MPDQIGWPEAAARHHTVRLQPSVTCAACGGEYELGTPHVCPTPGPAQEETSRCHG